MEENIKIIETYIKEREYKLKTRQEILFKEAIKNLIKGYKELEYQLEIEKIDNKYNQEERDEETIPRYKIREKIEFYKRYGKIKNSDEYVMSEEIEVLQELLQEGDDK